MPLATDSRPGDPQHCRADLVALVAVTALTRFAFRSHYLYDLDSVNFALALRRFDTSTHQPHPPGYFLYIGLGRLVNLIIPDANGALVAISIAFSCGAAAMIYLLAGDWFGRRAALFAGFIFVFSPLAWFHGIVALTYIVEGFFSALTGYLAWRIHSAEKRLVLPCAVVLGIAGGFRPSSLLFLTPLLLLALRRTGRRQAVAGMVTLLATISAWLIPMIQVSGGKRYLSSLLSLWLNVPSKGMIFNSSPFNSVARAGTVVGIYLLCFGCAAILPAICLRRDFMTDRRKAAFTAIWAAPGLLFFVFIYLRFVNSGYLMVLVPPVCVWMGLWASSWCTVLRLSRSTAILILAGCAAANTLIFVHAPVYCAYGEVRRFETELETIVEALPRLASSQDTMIVGFDSHFLGYRHAGYYLPGYLTVQFPEVTLNSGTWIFAMRDRDTWLETRLPNASIRNFILFPLSPRDVVYRDYVAQVRKRFPFGDLRRIIRSGYEFDIGPADDLRFLFPASAPLP